MSSRGPALPTSIRTSTGWSFTAWCRQPLEFSLNDLMRYPMESHIRFLECGGNSAPMWSKTPLQANVQQLHGLLSCSEWGGIRVSTLLDEAGVDPRASWVIAEGADGVTMQRSIPMGKMLDDAMIAFYQNGEPIVPWNGYPMRLFLPGYEGNMNVKWLRRLKVTDQPVMAINESRQYTELLDSGKVVALLLSAGSEQLHHAALADHDHAVARLLPDFRNCMVRTRTDRQGGGFRRWRQILGARGAAGARAAQGADPLPHAVELERRAGRRDEPRDR